MSWSGAGHSMHLYIVVDCKTQGCRTVHVLMHLGEKENAAEGCVLDVLSIDDRLPDLWQDLRFFRYGRSVLAKGAPASPA
jgi:hypothetical protein